METQIKANIFSGLFIALVGFLVLATLFSACIRVEEIQPPKAPDIHVSADLG